MQVFTVSQVKCDVKKVYYFLIGLDSNLQTVLGENATCHFQVRPSKSRFFRSERINKRMFRFRTQIKCDVENLKPGQILFGIEITFLQAKSVDASEGKKLR